MTPAPALLNRFVILPYNLSSLSLSLSFSLSPSPFFFFLSLSFSLYICLYFFKKLRRASRSYAKTGLSVEARPVGGGAQVVFIETRGKVPRELYIKKEDLDEHGAPGGVGVVPVCSGG